MEPMVRNRNGLSLIELLLASGLAIVVAFFAGKLFIQANTGLNNSMTRFGTQSTLNIIGGNLQKYLATGDTRFFAFSGKSPATDSLLARVFIPLPGYCADLSNACPQDSAFLYINYDKTVSPAVSS